MAAIRICPGPTWGARGRQSGGAQLVAHLSAQPCRPSPDTPRVPPLPARTLSNAAPYRPLTLSVSRGTPPFPPPASEVCVLSPGTSSGAVILGSRHPSPVSESCHHHLQGAPRVCHLPGPPTAPRPPLPPTALPHHPLSTERAQEARSSPLWSPCDPLLRPSAGAFGMKAAPSPGKRALPARPRATHGAHPCGRTRHGPRPRSVGTHALRFLFSPRRGV